MEGKYVVKCQITKSNCTCCNGPLYTRKCEYARLSLDGLHPHQAYFLAATQIEDDWRYLVIQGFIQTGEWPKKKGQLKEDAIRKSENPYGDFPYDVKFPSSQQIRSRADAENTLNSMREAKGAKVPEHFKWGTHRIEAANGKLGVVARRAALNDILWGRFTEWEKQGITVTAELLKKQVEFEEALRELQSAETEEEKEHLFIALRRNFL